MNAVRPVVRDACRAVLLAAALVAVARADDDVVTQEDEPAPPPAQAPVFGGGLQNNRVIIMPGLQLQVGGQGQLQVQGFNGRVPPAGAAAAGVVRKEAYLGVVAAEISPPVRAQLSLPEGVGLSIDAVAAGGPAEKAGVKQFDVIHKFNDQVVCSTEQLTTLVKVAGAGTTVPLTLVRGGREQVVEAVLEEHEVAVGGEGQVFAGAVPGVQVLNGWNGWQQGAAPQALPPPLPVAGLDPVAARAMAEALARAGAGNVVPPVFAPGMVPGVQGNMRAQVLTIGPNAQSATVVSDARGTLEIRSAGGKKTVTVKDPAGKEVYSGALDTDDDLAKVPDDYRDWVREADGGVKVLPPAAAEPRAERDDAAVE